LTRERVQEARPIEVVRQGRQVAKLDLFDDDIEVSTTDITLLQQRVEAESDELTVGCKGGTVLVRVDNEAVFTLA
jgi:hypothetical protein